MTSELLYPIYLWKNGSGRSEGVLGAVSGFCSLVGVSRKFLVKHTPYFHNKDSVLVLSISGLSVSYGNQLIVFVDVACMICTKQRQKISSGHVGTIFPNRVWRYSEI